MYLWLTFPVSSSHRSVRSSPRSVLPGCLSALAFSLDFPLELSWAQARGSASLLSCTAPLLGFLFPVSCGVFFLVHSLIPLASRERTQFLEAMSIWVHMGFWFGNTNSRIEKCILLFSCFSCCCLCGPSTSPSELRGDLSHCHNSCLVLQGKFLQIMSCHVPSAPCVPSAPLCLNVGPLVLL